MLKSKQLVLRDDGDHRSDFIPGGDGHRQHLRCEVEEGHGLEDRLGKVEGRSCGLLRLQL